MLVTARACVRFVCVCFEQLIHEMTKSLQIFGPRSKEEEDDDVVQANRCGSLCW